MLTSAPVRIWVVFPSHFQILYQSPIASLADPNHNKPLRFELPPAHMRVELVRSGGMRCKKECSMDQNVEIIYSGFWDRPLGFVARYRDVIFYFFREFNEDSDEYEDVYRVFLLPPLTEEDIRNSWDRLHTKTLRQVSTIRVSDVLFDVSFRKSIDANILDILVKDLSHETR
jgi:hypothetical protein